MKLQALDLSCFLSKSHFEGDGTHNYLLFQSRQRCFKKIGSTDRISEWKFKGLSAEIIEPSSTFDNSLASALNYFGNKERAIFDGSC